MHELRNKKRKWRVMLCAVLALGVIIIAIAATAHLTNSNTSSNSVNLMKQPGFVALQEVIFQQSDWLKRYGTRLELSAYSALIKMVYQTYVSVHGTEAVSSGGYLTGITDWLLPLSLRLGFVLIACARYWLLAIALGYFWKTFTTKAYQGNNILGQTGNGRIFFSGIRVGLDKLHLSGAPDLQVRGLACPAKVSASVLAKSASLKTLDKYHARNKTTEELLAIVEAATGCPAWAGLPGNSQDATSQHSPSVLAFTHDLLEALLELHAQTSNGSPGTDSEKKNGEDVIALPLDPDSILLPAVRGDVKVADTRAYAKYLAYIFSQCLYKELQQEFQRITPVELAALLLSTQAGKVLAYAREGKRWVQKSSFPHLSARAILHSTEHYHSEFSFEQRERLRRALTFASRRGAVAPVMLPKDMSRRVQVLRTLAELLYAPPAQLETTRVELELFVLCWEARRRFDKQFIGLFEKADDRVLNKSLVCGGNLFVPLETLQNVISESIPAQLLERMRSLMGASDRREIDPQESVTQKHAQYGRTLPLFTPGELIDYSKNFGINEKLLKKWEVSRQVLYSASWLSQRIGHQAVSECFISSISAQHKGSNQSRPEIYTGYVALRSGLLQGKAAEENLSAVRQLASVSLVENAARGSDKSGAAKKEGLNS